MRLAPKLKRMEHVELIGEYPRLPGGRMVRWLVGRPMDNLIRTDATFFHDATRGYPSRWLRLAGWKRSALRIVSVYGLLLTSFSAFSWRMGAERFVLQLLLLNVILSTPVLLLLDKRFRAEHGLRLPIRRAVEMEGLETDEEEDLETDGARAPRAIRSSARRWHLETIRVGRKQWEKEIVIPLARALAPLLQLPMDYQEPKADPVEIRLPASFSGADEGVRRRIERAASSRLQMLQVSATWQLHGEHPRLLLSAPPVPPKLVTFADVEKHLLETQEYRPLLGSVGSGEALHAEMVADSPHIAISGAPGSGKSTLMKLLIMQVLHWGWGVVVLDWKRTEAFDWLRGDNALPGVTYISDIEDIHDMGIRIGDEVDIRKNAGLRDRAKVLVVRDEWNATADLLMAWWQDYRGSLEPAERQRTPVKSPSLRGYAVLDFAGREFGVHDLVAAQRFSARVFNGNADIRECFQIKCLARYSDSTRKMLAPDIKPFPKKSNVPGRWTVVAGDEVAVVQVPLIQNNEARAYSLSGIANPLTPFSSSYTPSPAQPGVTGRTQGDQLGDRPAAPNVDSSIIDGEEVQIRTMKLKDLAEVFEPFGITHEILRHATKDSESGFPAPYGGDQFRGYTYDVEAVKIWTRRRHASQIAMKEAK
jgi:hypothetical protein